MTNDKRLDDEVKQEIIKLISDNQRPLTLNDIKVAIYESQKEIIALINHINEKTETRLNKLEIQQEKILNTLWFYNLAWGATVAALFWIVKILYSSGIKLI